jgi:hypothetical protein
LEAVRCQRQTLTPSCPTVTLSGEWYERFFPGRLVMTLESGDLSKDSNAIIEAHFS